MDYARNRPCGLRISRIGLGCEPLGGTDWGDVDVAHAVAAVRRAFDAGVTVFDTADVYGLGLSESRLADALGEARNEAVIVSKFGVNWQTNGSDRAQTFHDASPEHVVEALEGSLRRMRLEAIPVYLVHWPDPNVPLEDTLGALVRCREAGKVKAIGVSNYPLELLKTAHRICPLDAVEYPYSLMNRGIEQGVMEFCRLAGIAVLVYGVLAQGMLTGKYGPNQVFRPDDRRSRLPHASGTDKERCLELTNRLRDLGAQDGASAAQLAIRWALDAPGVDCAIVGARSPDQVDANLGALTTELSSADRLALASAPRETVRAL